VDYNEEICLARAKPRWNDEEIKLLTLEEARAPPHVRAMNLYLLERHRSNRSLESIKCIRKKQSYRNLIIEFRNLRLSRRIDEIVGLQGSQVAATDRLLVSGSAAAREWLLAKKSDIIPEMNGGIWIRAAIGRLEQGQLPNDALEDWWRNMFPDLEVAFILRADSDCSWPSS